MEVYNELWIFLKNPVYQKDENTDSRYRIRVFMLLLILALVLCTTIGFIMSAAESFIGLDLGTHAIEKALKDLSPWAMLVLAVLVAPLFEELIFRGPMVWFKDKSYFKTVFWFSTFLFGYVHLTNFEITAPILLFSFFIVLPQLIIGAILGFIRIRLSLLWAIGLHAVYNLILLGPALLMRDSEFSFLTE